MWVRAGEWLGDGPAKKTSGIHTWLRFFIFWSILLDIRALALFPGLEGCEETGVFREADGVEKTEMVRAWMV